MISPKQKDNKRIPKTDNIKSKDNKKALLEQFKQQSIKNKVESSNSDSKNDEFENKDLNKFTNTINKLNKEIKSKDLKIQKLQSQVDEFNMFKIKNNDKINRYFNEIQELKDVVVNKDIDILGLNSTIDKLKDIIEENSLRLAELEDKVGEGYIHPLEEENKKLIIQHKDIINRINQLKNLYNKVKLELSEEKEEEYNSKIEGMKKYISVKKMSYEDSKEKWVNHIKGVENKLENLKVTNEKLQNRIIYLERKKGIALKKSIRKWFKLLKNKKDDIKFSLIRLYKKVTNKNYNYVSHVYGKLHSKGKRFYITDINTGEILKVRYFFKKYENLDDKICKGILTDKGDVVVIFVFLNESDYFIDINKGNTKKANVNKKKDLKDKVKPQRLYNFEYRVLMISSMLKSDYIEYFASIGIEMDWFDSYKESATRLKSILSKYDIVFYSTGHSRHFVGNIIRQQNDFKNNRDKYIYITNQSKEIMEKELMSAVSLIKKKQRESEKEVSLGIEE